jgi:hypothetical protein
MACDQCGARVRDDLLSLDHDGRYLCRPCLGSYLVAAADRQARKAEIFRRCSCGAVLSPVGDMSIDPSYHGDDGVLTSIEHVLKPRRYSCPKCRKSFTVRHGVVIAQVLPYLLIGWFLFGSDDNGIRLIGAIVEVVAMTMFAWLIAPRVRFPRVR